VGITGTYLASPGFMRLIAAATASRAVAGKLIGLISTFTLGHPVTQPPQWRPSSLCPKPPTSHPPSQWHLRSLLCFTLRLALHLPSWRDAFTFSFSALQPSTLPVYFLPHLLFWINIFVERVVLIYCSLLLKKHGHFVFFRAKETMMT